MPGRLRSSVHVLEGALVWSIVVSYVGRIGRKVRRFFRLGRLSVAIMVNVDGYFAIVIQRIPLLLGLSARYSAEVSDVILAGVDNEPLSPYVRNSEY